MYIPNGYHSGGASYVLSRESLRRFSRAHRHGNAVCREDGGSEDVEIARCLRGLGVIPGRSLDAHGRELFHPLPFSHHFRGMFPGWLHLIAEHPLKKVSDLLADSLFVNISSFRAMNAVASEAFPFTMSPRKTSI